MNAGIKCVPFLVLAFISSLGPNTASAQAVSEACAARFANAGAVPGSTQCFTTAINSAATLNSFACTVNTDVPRAFCTGTPEEPCGLNELRDFDTGR